MPQSLDEIMSSRDGSGPETTVTVNDAEFAANPNGTAQAIRDEQGRFAPKAEAAQPEPQQDDGHEPEPQQRRPGTVPQQALEAERRKRQERDDQIAELTRQNALLLQRMAPQPQTPVQPQQKPPEWWEDPAAATDYRLKGAIDPVRQEMEAFKVAVSRNFAEQQHGKETVQAAIDGIRDLSQSNPAEYQRLEMLAGRSMDPVGDLVRWHKQQRAVSEVGDDPEAYFQRRLAEWQAAQDGHDQDTDPQQRAPNQPAAAAPPRLPTAFAKLPAGGPRGGPGVTGPRPLSEIMARG